MTSTTSTPSLPHTSTATVPANGAVSASAIVLRRQRHGLARREPERERVRVVWLDGDHANAVRNACRRDPGHQTASAARNDDRVDLGDVFEDLQPDGPGSGHDDRIVERMDEHATGLL